MSDKTDMERMLAKVQADSFHIIYCTEPNCITVFTDIDAGLCIHTLFVFDGEGNLEKFRSYRGEDY